MAEAFTVLPAQSFVLRQQFMGAQHKFGEVHHVQPPAGAFIFTVNAPQLLLQRAVDALQIGRAAALLLVAVDEPLRLARRPLFLVQMQVAQDAAD